MYYFLLYSTNADLSAIINFFLRPWTWISIYQATLDSENIVCWSPYQWKQVGKLSIDSINKFLLST